MWDSGAKLIDLMFHIESQVNAAIRSVHKTMGL